MLLPLWVGAFVSGLTVSFACPRWVAVVFAVLAVLAMGWRLTRRGPVLAAACLAFAIGIGAGRWALPDDLAPLRDAEPLPSRVVGRITQGPESDGHGRSLSHWRLEVTRVDGRAALGTLLLTTAAEGAAAEPAACCEV